VPGSVSQADQFQGRSDPAPAVPPAQPSQEQWQLDILLGGEDRNQVERLKNKADMLIAPVGQLGLVKTRYFDILDPAGTGGRPVNPGNDMQEGGFARTGRPHECQKLAGRNVKGHITQGGDLTFTLSVNLRKVSNPHYGIWRLHKLERFTSTSSGRTPQPD
jgi:hypothetical protein